MPGLAGKTLPRRSAAQGGQGGNQSPTRPASAGSEQLESKARGLAAHLGCDMGQAREMAAVLLQCDAADSSDDAKRQEAHRKEAEAFAQKVTAEARAAGVIR